MIKNYADILHQSSCNDIYEIVDLCKNLVPIEYRSTAWKYPELNHGLNLLTTENALNAYMSAYGDMHISKCRAAMMNFPFKDLVGSIEIVDWGCGQGIGSCTIIDILQQRDLLQWVKRITMIEPSSQALNRAEQNIYKITQNNIPINTINKYLPSYNIDTSDTLNSINYSCKNVIHIFSNILDVNGIDLYSVARLVATSNADHYIICVGPKNANAYKIDQFCALFDGQDFFTNIDSASFGRTANTAHTYTCKSKGFKYNGAPLIKERMSSFQQIHNDVFNDYDLQLHIQNKIISVEKARVAYRLQEMLSMDDIMYIDPIINEVKIDFVIIKPQKGILLLNVFPYNLLKCSRPDNGKEVIYHSDNGKDYTYQSPFELIALCKSNLEEGIEELLMSNIKGLGESIPIKSALVFMENDIVYTKNFLHARDDFFDNSYIYGREFIYNIDVSKKLYQKVGLVDYNKHFTDGIKRKIISILSPGWHSYKEGKLGIQPRGAQKHLSKSRKIQQKISGVAGSGKTFVLALRAIDAMKRTGGDVLVLTYNITLAKYLKVRMSEIREDFSWSKIDILHYHSFFKLRATENRLKVHIDSFDQVDFFNYAKKLKKYSAIFIDEVQDYKEEWLRIVMNNFLEENGEFVVFGDPKQNIFNRELDKEGNVRLGVIGGVWNKELNKSQRFSNPRLLSLANAFQSNFFSKQDGMESDNLQNTTLNFDIISYFDMRNGCGIDELVLKINEIIKNSGNDIRNFVVLGSTKKILREFDFAFRNKTKEETEITFLSTEILDSIMQKFNVKSENSWNMEYQMIYKSLERVRKLSFTTDKACLKISTIQSFKGWDAPAVILILEDDVVNKRMDFQPMSPETIYTAITRPRESIYIINIGQNAYHDFFRKQSM